MAIVIPRAFSSGALSIESKGRNFTFGFAFASTFVIAAVNVVFPWSMCPIVPTFMCGFERSNFSFAMIRNLPNALKLISPSMSLSQGHEPSSIRELRHSIHAEDTESDPSGFLRQGRVPGAETRLQSQ